MYESCDVMIIFRIFDQFRAVQRPDSGRKNYVFSDSNLLFYKAWKKN